jgi:hypothetical protein
MAPAELGQLRLERAVVELGEGVGPLEAAHGVVLRRIVGLEPGQVPQVAPRREVPGHHHRPSAELDQLLHTYGVCTGSIYLFLTGCETTRRLVLGTYDERSADAGDDVGDVGPDLVDGPALEQGLVVVVPADLSDEEQQARHDFTR